jgi:hypothetical protein
MCLFIFVYSPLAGTFKQPLTTRVSQNKYKSLKTGSASTAFSQRVQRRLSENQSKMCPQSPKMWLEYGWNSKIVNDGLPHSILLEVGVI